MKRTAIQRRTPLRSRPKPVERQERVRPPVKPVERRGVYRAVSDTPSLPVAEQPKPKAKRTRATELERQHMGLVAELGCLLCSSPAEVHHIREGQGMSQRASNWLTVPLCPEHHRGSSGLHGLGERGFATRHRLGELDLLAMTLERLARS